MEELQKAIEVSERYHQLIRRLELDQVNELDGKLVLVKKELTDEDLLFIDHFIGTKAWSIHQLNLSNNRLKIFPNLKSFSHLLCLRIDNNELIQVPDFSTTPKLTYLDLRENQLTAIPDLSHLNLVCLDLRRNPIREVPKNLYNFREFYVDLPLDKEVLSEGIPVRREIPSVPDEQSLEMMKAFLRSFMISMKSSLEKTEKGKKLVEEILKIVDTE